jgi:NADH:ubiquinone oxidoreductase subunit 3 (subunit A)
MVVLSVDDASININWQIIGSSRNKDYKCLSIRNWEEKEVKSTKDYFGVSIWLLISSIILSITIVVLFPWIVSVELRLLKKKEYEQINY